MTNPRSDRFSLAAISRDNPGRRRLKIRGLSFVLIKLQLSPYPLNRYSGHRGLSSVYPSIHPTIRCKNRPLSPVSTPFRRVSKNFLPHPYLQIKIFSSNDRGFIESDFFDRLFLLKTIRIRNIYVSSKKRRECQKFYRKGKDRHEDCSSNRMKTRGGGEEREESTSPSLMEHLKERRGKEMERVGRKREIGVGFKGLFSLLFRMVRASARLLSSCTRASA